MEASNPNNPHKKAGFTTSKFDITNLDNPELTFRAHMFSDSNHMGNLYLDIYTDGTWENEVLHLKDNHGDKWFEVKQDLTNYVGKRVIFRFRGITGESWASDMCIDDFKVASALITSTGKITQEVQDTYTLANTGTRICFRIPDGNNKKGVILSLFSVQGKLVKEYIREGVDGGYYTVDFLSGVAAGMYLCRMKTDKFEKSISVVLVR